MDEPTTPARKAVPAAGKAKAPATESRANGVYCVTIDRDKRRVLSVETLDGGGKHRPLTSEERAELASAPAAMTLRHLVERAFEAGIESVLGDGSDPDTTESRDECELSSILLRTLIGGSKVRDLINGDELNRTLFDTLIGQAVAKPVTSVTP